MDIVWNAHKNALLKRTRGVSFEELLADRMLGVLKHPSRPNQRVLLIERSGYVWEMPFVVKGDEIFLKTMYRSRKWTRKWKRGEI